MHPEGDTLGQTDSQQEGQVHLAIDEQVGATPRIEEPKAELIQGRHAGIGQGIRGDVERSGLAGVSVGSPIGDSSEILLDSRRFHEHFNERGPLTQFQFAELQRFGGCRHKIIG